MPLADSTLVQAPDGISDQALILMADIFPTGYFAVRNAFKEMTDKQIAEATVVVIGCGFVPVLRAVYLSEDAETVWKTSGTLCDSERNRSTTKACVCTRLCPNST